MASTSEQCTSCIDDLVVDPKSLGGRSEITICLCMNKGQVHQEQLPELDARFEEMLQQFCDPQDQVDVNGLPSMEIPSVFGIPSVPNLLGVDDVDETVETAGTEDT